MEPPYEQSDVSQSANRTQCYQQQHDAQSNANTNQSGGGCVNKELASRKMLW